MNKDFKTRFDYGKKWTQFYDELLNLRPENTICKDFNHYKECWENGIDPNTALKLLKNLNR